MSDDYNVFISWSGARSRWVADAMMGFLPVVLQSVKPWMSSTSIDKGSRSSNAISDALRSVKMGIVCLTPENLLSPWLLFEAGALSNAVAQKSHVCTYLLGGLAPAQVEKPLGEFQHTSPDKNDTLKLLRTINAALATNSVSDAVLERSFEGQWPSFEQKLRTMPPTGEAAIVKRQTEDIVSEVLEITRAQASSIRSMQSQLSHVEATLNRAPFGDNGMVLPNIFASGTNIPLSSLAGNLYTDMKPYTILTAPIREQDSGRTDVQSLKIKQKSKDDKK